MLNDPEVGRVTFGPFSRFQARPYYSGGLLAGYELWDAEQPDASGYATRLRNFKFFLDASEHAAKLVAPEFASDTACGALIVSALFA